MARYDPLGVRKKVALKRQENQIVEASESRVHVPGSWLRTWEKRWVTACEPPGCKPTRRSPDTPCTRRTPLDTQSPIGVDGRPSSGSREGQ